MKGNGEAHIRADPPLIVPIRDLVDRAGARRLELAARMLLDPYPARLSGDGRRVLERYRYADLARKVVGVGSVGNALLGDPAGTRPRAMRCAFRQRRRRAPHSSGSPAGLGSPTRGSGWSRASALMQAASEHPSSDGWVSRPVSRTSSCTTSTSISCPRTGQQGATWVRLRRSGSRVVGASARRRTAELLQLGLDRSGDLVDRLGTETDLSTQSQRNRSPIANFCGPRSPTRTHLVTGLPAQLERFDLRTENRGVPGSSPGFAIPPSRMAGGFSLSDGARWPLIGHSIGHRAWRSCSERLAAGAQSSCGFGRPG